MFSSVSEPRLEASRSSSTVLSQDNTSETSSSGKISPLPTFLDMTKHELKSPPSEEARRIVEMESRNSNGSKDPNADQIGLSLTQIAGFERSDTIAKPESDDQETSHVWTIPEVESLLRFYKARETDLKDPRRKKKTIWNEICIEMRTLGFLVTPGQCECKMKNMKATYRRSLDRVKAGDNNTPRCAFYDELYDIFGPSPPVRAFPNSHIDRESRKRNHNMQTELVKVNDDIITVVSEEQARQSQNIGLILGQDRHGLNLKISNPEVVGHMENNAYSEIDTQKASSSNAEYIEELTILRKSLEQERQARDEERKKNDEERDRRAREFHEERMAMLNSMNRLISSLGGAGKA